MGSLLDIILGKMGAAGKPTKAKPSSSKKVRSLRSRKKHSKVKFGEGKTSTLRGEATTSRPRAARFNVPKRPQKAGGSSKKKKG